MKFISKILKSKKSNSNVSKKNETSTIQNIKEKTVNQTIFNEVIVFTYKDFEDLDNNEKYDKFNIGQINIHSGKIVCADPLFRELGYPQNWKVNNGKYYVNIYISKVGIFKGRVGYAEMVFSKNIIEKWEISLIDEKHLKDNFEKMMNGFYPVENGLSSFSDYQTWNDYNNYVSKYQSEKPENNFYLDKLEKEFKKNNGIPKSSRGEDWINYSSDLLNGNIIMFGSGWGDGLYPRFIGFDCNRKPVKFITDFTKINIL